MKKTLFIIAVTFFLTAPSVSDVAAQLIDGSLTHDGTNREYLLYVPESYIGDESTPLVMIYHGHGMPASDMMAYADFRFIAELGGFIVVYPQGTLDGGGEEFWNNTCKSGLTDDVGFTEALIDAIASEYNIDPTRVYAAGFSNGGFMSYTLACQLSDRFAAVVSVAGSMITNTITSCEAQRSDSHPRPLPSHVVWKHHKRGHYVVNDWRLSLCRGGSRTAPTHTP